MNFCDKFKIKNCMIINNWDYKKNKNKKQTKPNQKKKKKKLITKPNKTKPKKSFMGCLDFVFPSLITQKWWNP